MACVRAAGGPALRWHVHLPPAFEELLVNLQAPHVWANFGSQCRTERSSVALYTIYAHVQSGSALLCVHRR